MSKTRKILSIVLALAMVVSTFAISAYAGAAYESEEDAGNYNQTWALSEVDNGDDTHTVSVSLTTDYATGAIQFVLTNTDDAAVTFVEDSAVLGADYPYDADFSAYKREDGSVIVMIIPDTTGETLIEAAEIDGVIAELTYTLVSGSADIALEDDAASATNPAGSLIAARADDGNLVTSTMVVGQTVAIEEGMESVTIGNAALPSDLVKKATAEAGIIIDKGHTFGGAYDGVVFGFTQTAANTFMNTNYLTNNLEATNEGTLTFSRSIGKTGYGTGTVITVTGKDGDPKQYVVVIFADVDGNGLTNTNDVTAVSKIVNKVTACENNSVQRMAANCQNVGNATMMHTLNTNDVTAVSKHVNGTKVDQAALASRIVSNTQFYL